MKNLHMYSGLLVACICFSGCVSSGPVKEADTAFNAVVSAKGYTPLPNPISRLDVGELYVVHGEGGQRDLAPVPACRGLFSSVGQAEPQTSPWGSAYQTSATGFNASAAFSQKAPAGTSPVDSASAGIGYARYDSYQIDLGEVNINRIDANEYDDFKGILTERCLNWIERVESLGRLDNVVLVAATATSPNLSFTYELNPLPGRREALIAEGGKLSVAEKAAYEGKCGPSSDAQLGLLKALNININGSYCVRGTQKVTSTVPYVIGVIAYSAEQLRADDSISAGTDGRVLLEQASQIDGFSSLDQTTSSLDVGTLAQILAE